MCFVGTSDRACAGGHKYTGKAERKWRCWIIEDSNRQEKAKEEAEKDVRRIRNVGETHSPAVADVLTPPGQMETLTRVTGGSAVSSERIGMFTTGVTGS